MYEELYKKLCTTFSGFLHEFIPRPMSGASEEEREATFERLWDLGGFNFLCTFHLCHTTATVGPFHLAI